MSTSNSNMPKSHMEPLASWGNNSHTKVTETFESKFAFEYVVYEMPRSMFRAAASLFSDIRHTNASAKFDEITFQTFLQMISM